MLYQRILELRRQIGELTAEGKAMLAKQKTEERQLVEDELKRFDAITKDIETKKVELDDCERQYSMQVADEDLARRSVPVPPTSQPPTMPAVAGQRSQPGTVPSGVAAAQRAVMVIGSTEEEFKTPGEFLTVMRFMPGCDLMQQYRRRTEPELNRIMTSFEQRGFSMGDGVEGGLMVMPQVMSSELLRLEGEKGIVRSLARVIPAGESPDAPLAIPAFTQGSSGANGGAAVQWTAEAGTSNETDGEIEDVILEPKEMTAHSIVTNKLLRNASAAEGFIMGLLSDAKVSGEDYAFLRGNGVGKPQGAIYAYGRANVTRNTASKFLYEDVVAMEMAVYPPSQDKLRWIINRSVFAQVKDMKDSSGNRIYTDANLVKGFPAMLDGIPVIWTGRTPTLGNFGDVVLADLSYYIIRDGFGPLIGMNPYLYSLTNRTVIQIVASVDGQAWVREPLTLEDGSTQVSPIVVLN